MQEMSILSTVLLVALFIRVPYSVSESTCSCINRTAFEREVRILLGSLEQKATCSDILAARPKSPSGTYTVQISPGNSERVYCFMGTLPGCGGGGWRRIGFFDRSDTQVNCPSGFTEHNQQGAIGCSIPDVGCSSISFSTNGQNYTRVCGWVRGYGTLTCDSFERFSFGGNISDINTAYLDGVSITHGIPRKHLWSYVASQVNTNVATVNCPCSGQTNTKPFFVGDDYHCESCNNSNILWDGKDCAAVEMAGCCTKPNLPWFYRNVSETSDSVELRLCRDEPAFNEDIILNKYELYIQ